MQHITRIAAKDSGSDKTFISYVIPTVPISLNAHQKTCPTTMSVAWTASGISQDHICFGKNLEMAPEVSQHYFSGP